MGPSADVQTLCTWLGLSYSTTSGRCYTTCTNWVNVPNFNFKIGTLIIPVNTQDNFVFKSSTNCYLPVIGSGNEWILGAALLRQLYTIHDFTDFGSGKGKLGIAQKNLNSPVTTAPPSSGGTTCVAGLTWLSGSTCVTCSSPSSGYFTSSICTITQDTKFTLCSSPSSSQYVSSLCNPGTSSTLGIDTGVSSCGTLTSGTYISGACIHGTSSSKGLAAIISTCSSPTLTQYVSVACLSGSLTTTVTTLGSNTVILSCGSLSAGQFVSTACVSGSFSQAGSPSVISACSSPTSTQFTSTACSQGALPATLGSNTKFSTCISPQTGYSIASACKPGTYLTLGSQASGFSCANGYSGSASLVSSTTTLNGCNLVASSSCIDGSTYMSSNGQCVGCSPPSMGSYVTSICTMTSNTLTAPCSLPSSSLQYVSVACVSGSATTLGSNSQVATCPNPTVNSLTYVSTTCIQGSFSSKGSPSIISACLSPINGQYVSGTCILGSATTLGSNTQISQCIPQQSGYTPSSPCVPGSPSILGTQASGFTCTSGFSGVASFLSGTTTLKGCTVISMTDCVIGYTYLLNGKCVGCSPPPSNYFVSSTCTLTLNTVSSPCATTTASTGYITLMSCSSGSPTSLGSQPILACDYGYSGSPIISSGNSLSGCIKSSNPIVMKPLTLLNSPLSDVMNATSREIFYFTVDESIMSDMNLLGLLNFTLVSNNPTVMGMYIAFNNQSPDPMVVGTTLSDSVSMQNGNGVQSVLISSKDIKVGIYYLVIQNWGSLTSSFNLNAEIGSMMGSVCLPNTCNNHGTCSSSSNGGGVTCACNSGWSGSFCSTSSSALVLPPGVQNTIGGGGTILGLSLVAFYAIVAAVATLVIIVLVVVIIRRRKSGGNTSLPTRGLGGGGGKTQQIVHNPVSLPMNAWAGSGERNKNTGTTTTNNNSGSRPAVSPPTITNKGLPPNWSKEFDA